MNDYPRVIAPACGAPARQAATAARSSEATLHRRAPRDIFGCYLAALINGDLDQLVANYEDDAVYVTSSAVWRGKDAVRKGLNDLLLEVPDAAWAVPVQVFAGNILLVRWSAISDDSEIAGGTDTFVFGDDGIRVHTSYYDLNEVG